MNKPVSVKEFIKNTGVKTSPTSGLQTYLKDDVVMLLKQFAQQWVEYTKYQCAKEACLTTESYMSLQESSCMDIDKQSILDAVKIEEVI